MITTRIEDQLSEELLRGRVSRGDKVTIDVDPEGGFTFNAAPSGKPKKPEPAPAAPAPSE